MISKLTHLKDSYSKRKDQRSRQPEIRSAGDFSQPGLLSLVSKNPISAVGNGVKRQILQAKALVVPLASKKLSPSTTHSGGGGLLFRSFLIVVLLPTLMALLYYTFFASNVYVAEAKLTVKQAVVGSSKSDASSVLSGLGIGGISIGKPQATTQDTMMVLDYIKSRAIVQDIGGKVEMNSLYAKEEIDWLSRLGRDNDLEENWEYWKTHVTVSVDTISSILTLRVRAYTPEDALKIAEDIVFRSEALINNISQRNRRDALTRAEEEVGRAAEKLVEARASLLMFQQRSGSMDPVETAKQLTESVSSLTLQKIALETQLATASANGVGGRPGEKYIKSRLAAIDGQLADLDNRLTGPVNERSVSAQLRDYELFKLQEEFSERIYTLARTSYEDARRNLERQQLYLAVVVPPLLPEYALYPRVFADTSLVFLGCLVLWGIVALLVASVRDSMN